MLKELLEKERSVLNHFFDRLDLQKMEKILDALFQCEGTLFITGVGKSGFIAEKIAVTMVSTGTRAFYLSPTNALHGDLGIVRKKDICLLFSKSGESDELLTLIPFLRNRGALIVGVASNRGSRLLKACDLGITLPLETELCPFDMVPTTSTTIQGIFGDMLCIGLMKRRNFTLDEYALNHPAGRIGKRAAVKVSDLMLKGADIPTCKVSDKLIDALVVLSDKNCGCVLILDDKKKLQGLFTDGDLRRSLQTHGQQVLNFALSDLMTKEPRTINSCSLAFDALRYMESDQKKPITTLAVINENRQVEGVIKMHDILQAGI